MPPHYAPEHDHASVFQYTGVVKAYQNRPPYPGELYAMLRELVVDEPRVILELGCGLGEIARELATDADLVDAVDPSEAMLALGRSLPGGDHPNLRWHHSSAEEFEYPATYGLIVAADSLFWMDRGAVFPLMSRALSARGRLAIVHREHDAPWSAQLPALIRRFSTITGYSYLASDMIEELQKEDLFELERRCTTSPVPYRQSVDDYVEFWHSRSACSRDRMGADEAARFDAELRQIVEPYSTEGILRYDVSADVVSGRPREP